MTVYKPRSAWTSSKRGGAQLTGSKLTGIAWHWPGTSQNVIGVESEAATANRLRGYRNFHVGSRGWSDIGYNFAIDQAGRVWDLRGLGRVGAHCASPSNPDANHEWHGVLLILGNREKPSAAMIEACQDFTHDVFLARWPGRTRDTGHGRAPGVPGAQTSCPGPFAAELIVDNQLNRRPQSPQPEEDDDMPATVKAPNGEQWDTDHALSWMMSRLADLAPWGEYVTAPNGEPWSLPHVMSWLMRRDQDGRDMLANLLAGQREIMHAQGVEVDEQALAQQISAVLVPAVIEALPDTGLTEAEVEDASERAVRAVLGSLDDAD